jgi:hypothetical protein
MPSTKNYDDNEDNNFDGNDTERKTRVRRRRFFPTRIGGLCVNAKTGQHYPWRQGSFEELRLYKVINSTAYYDKDGFHRRRKDEINKEPLILYYDSPQEFARHNKCKLDEDLIKWWTARRDVAFPDETFDKEAYLAWISKNSRWSQSQPNKETTGMNEEEW